ncbi:regulator [Aliivibrio fischeri]|uniref:Rid family hydrolase n=1 Tax=Aliivibrio fischeri TaxID=668 RepID=UPI00080E8587|nr:Rid family hydrolase [Aliivibrio fischeri]OCH33690.1 regulator [Aliivibrio fischeri]
MKEIIVAASAPEAIGPYSHGTQFNGLIFTSGQLPVDGSTSKVVEGGITEQSQMSLQNLIAVIEAGGGDVNTVLKTDCPARSCFAVKDLPLGVLVEVEAIAHQK